jgi:hypothetical protein
MPSFTQLFTLALVVAGSLAAAVVPCKALLIGLKRTDFHSKLNTVAAHCPGAVLVSSTSFEVDGKAAVHTTHSCDLSGVSKRTASTIVNVCDAACKSNFAKHIEVSSGLLFLLNRYH